MALLTLSDIRVRYGSVEALHGIDLTVDEGEIVTILGANGAGKSTTLLSISGLVRPSSGEILFDGKPLLRLPSHEVVGLGIAQSPEGRRVFGAMSVLENLRLGAFSIRDKARSERTLEWIFDLFPRLMERKGQLAGSPSAMSVPCSSTTSFSQTCITRRMSCSMSKMVMPRPRMARISSTRAAVSWSFMPPAGSSRMSRRGSEASARAISRRRWLP